MSWLKWQKKVFAHLHTMKWSLVGVGTKMLNKLFAGRKLFPTLSTLLNLSTWWLPASTSVLLDMYCLVFCQFLAGGKPTSTVTDVRSLISMQYEMLSQFCRSVELHRTPGTVKQLHSNDRVHLNRLQFNSRLYVTIEMVGQLWLKSETFSARFALVWQFLLCCRRRFSGFFWSSLWWWTGSTVDDRVDCHAEVTVDGILHTTHHHGISRVTYSCPQSTIGFNPGTTHYSTRSYIITAALVSSHILVTERWARSWSRCTGSQPTDDFFYVIAQW